MPKKLVYFENWMDPVAEEILGAAPEVDLVRLSFDGPEADNWAALEQAHGYQFRPKTELQQPWFGTRELLERCPNLLAVSSTGAGYDMIDADACTDLGIMVVNNSGSNSVSVAQHVLGQMLALSKQIAQTDKAMRRDAAVDRFDFVGSELTGKTLGIVGLGNIGRRVSAYAAVFGMTVIAYDPYITEDDFRERGATPVDFDKLFREADFVSLNCPLTDETRGMIDARAFGMMKPSAYFITTARGGIHDEDALVAALAEGRIRGAGVDVFVKEPTGRDHPLTRFENVLLSPHNAGITFECNYGMAKNGAEQWLEILRGNRPPRLKNPEVWERYKERYARIVGRPLAAA